MKLEVPTFLSLSRHIPFSGPLWGREEEYRVRSFQLDVDEDFNFQRQQRRGQIGQPIYHGVRLEDCMQDLPDLPNPQVCKLRPAGHLETMWRLSLRA